jgi:hypothetical protein
MPGREQITRRDVKSSKPEIKHPRDVEMFRHDIDAHGNVKTSRLEIKYLGGFELVKARSKTLMRM